MKESATARRMAENEVIFRGHNERMQQGFAEVREMGRRTNQEHLIPHDDTQLYFYCECADENCQERIRIKPSVYTRIHANRKRFVIVPGHQVAQVEQVVEKASGFMIVEKLKTPPASAAALNPTGVKNT